MGQVLSCSPPFFLSGAWLLSSGANHEGHEGHEEDLLVLGVLSVAQLLGSTRCLTSWFAAACHDETKIFFVAFVLFVSFVVTWQGVAESDCGGRR